MAKKYIILDTETTGLSFKDGHKIVEIACIETQDLVPTNNILPPLLAISLRKTNALCSKGTVCCRSII